MTESDEIKDLFFKLKNSAFHKFPDVGKVISTTRRGVYIISNENGTVLHVGSTPKGKEGINKRLNDHLSGTSSFRRLYLQPNKVCLRIGYQFQYLEVDNPRQRSLLEALTAGLLCPIHFGTGGDCSNA